MLGTRVDDGSVVALIPSGLNGYRFYDRKTGKTVRVNSKNQNMIEKEAIAFYKPFPLAKMSAGDLFKYIIRQISVSDLVPLIVVMIVITCVGLITPWMNNLLFSDVIESGSLSVLLGVASFMICAAVSALMLTSVRALLISR